MPSLRRVIWTFSKKKKTALNRNQHCRLPSLPGSPRRRGRAAASAHKWAAKEEVLKWAQWTTTTPITPPGFGFRFRYRWNVNKMLNLARKRLRENPNFPTLSPSSSIAAASWRSHGYGVRAPALPPRAARRLYLRLRGAGRASSPLPAPRASSSSFSPATRRPLRRIRRAAARGRARPGRLLLQRSRSGRKTHRRRRQGLARLPGMVIRFCARCFCSAVARGCCSPTRNSESKCANVQFALVRYDRYLVALDKNPIATKAVTSAVLTLAGDLICQVYLQRLASVFMQCSKHLASVFMQCSKDFVVSNGFRAA